ncbi:MAG: NAD(P)/FAD-dependent oxidoreductase [Polyangiales bacterium]
MTAPSVTPRVRANELLARDWDVIVVGAGIGGLLCASMLARYAKLRVLVLERHYELGGLSQTFRRPNYRWEVGVHYVGEMGEGRLIRRAVDLACDRRIEWAQLPSARDRLITPEINARLGGDRDALRRQWLAIAPGEERAIDWFLDAVIECARLAPAHFVSRLSRASSRPKRSPFLSWSDRTSASVIEESGASPRLAALMSYPWTTYGLPPTESSFAALAATAAHYLHGAFHPIGGGSALSTAIADTISNAGGAVVVRAEVARLACANGRATGVVLSDGTEARAPIVVSAVGAWGTFSWLAPDDHAMRERVRAIGPSGCHVALYLGIKRSPRALGLDGANLFIRRDRVDHTHRDCEQWCDGDADEPPDLYLSTACAIDPSFEARYPGRTAIIAASGASLASFARWENTRRGHRGAAYNERKARLTESMLRVIRRHLSLDALEHVELSTPLSTRDFCAHPSGEIYGLAPTPARFRDGPGPWTSTEGLFLTGQDVWSTGVAGAIAGGVLTACAITKRDLFARIAMR